MILCIYKCPSGLHLADDAISKIYLIRVRYSYGVTKCIPMQVALSAARECLPHYNDNPRYPLPWAQSSQTPTKNDYWIRSYIYQLVTWTLGKHMKRHKNPRNTLHNKKYYWTNQMAQREEKLTCTINPMLVSDFLKVNWLYFSTWTDYEGVVCYKLGD